MREKLLCILMIMLVLTNIVGAANFIKPSSAGSIEDSGLNMDFVGKLNDVASPSRSVEHAPVQARAEAPKAQGQSSQDCSRWNFSRTNDWSKFAYTDGDKTRLVVGVNGKRPASTLELEKIAAKHEARMVNTVSIKGEVMAVVVELLFASVPGFVEETRAIGAASYVEPNMKVQAQLVPNDPEWGSQWGPQKVEADWAWNTTVGDPSVLVAVVDTGIYYTHPDLAPNYVPLGYDWVNNDPDPVDDHGHGTHCAGIIAAVLNNGVGIAGLAQVRVMAEKVLGSGGGGTSDQVANGIINATDCGADIISMSLGGYGDSELVHEAVRYACERGVLVIAAAGNDNTNMKSYPAAYDEVVAVAATDQYDSKADFSNWGDWIELAAPGVGVYSTVPWGYESWSGTSMACPHVSGLAALLWSRYPTKSKDWVRLWLRYTADDLGYPGFDVYYGHGRINARKAVEQIPPAHELIAFSWSTPPYVNPGTRATINATALNFGGNDETSVEVRFLANNSVVDSAVVDLASGTSTKIGFSWSPAVEGLYDVAVYLVPVAGETNLENNVLRKYLYVGFPVKAFVLHSAGNLLGEVIANWQELNSEWRLFGNTMVYIDYTTLNRESITYEDITATDADVLIISSAYDPYYGWQFTDSEIEAITQYVHEGHGLIATAGTFYSMVPNNNKLAPLFGLNETTAWTSTGNDFLDLLSTTHPIFASVPDPLVFPRVGTALPSDGLWDSSELSGGTYLAFGHYRESAIVTFRGLVYISPWLETIPPYYHHHLQLLYNAITWSRYQKPQHELTVSLEVPRALKPGKSTLVNATVLNNGLSNETGVELQLLINSAVIDSTIIPELRARESYTLGHLWTPTAEGVYNITAYAPPVYGEDDIRNNVKSSKVTVSNLSVALFQNSDSWGYPSNQEALDRYDVPYIVFSSDDVGRVDLSAFTKVVIASDQDQSFYNAIDSYRQWFEDYASNGGVLEIHAADWGWHGGGWIGLLPGGLQLTHFAGQYVTVVDPTHPLLTTPNTITETELDNWNYAVHGYFNIYPADAHIIIIEDSYSMPAYLEFRYGSGFITASSQTLEWAYPQKYSLILENSLLYMPRKFEHDLAVSLAAPALLGIGNSSLLNATVRNLGLNNEINVELFLLINSGVVNHIEISELQAGEEYSMGYLWTPAEGTYNVTAYAPLLPGEEYAANNVATELVKVKPVKGYILFDQTHGTDNIAHYSIWTSNLAERDYAIETQRSGSITRATLEHFNIFVIPQARANYSTDELSAIQSFVLSGGGLLVIGDDSPWIYTDLTNFAGIIWSAGGYGGSFTSDITLHPVTEGVAGAYFGAPMSLINVASPAIDLIRDFYGNKMLAVSELNSGKVLCMADEDSINDGQIFYADNLRLANNMIDWFVAPKPEHDLAVSLFAPSFLEQPLTLINATVMNRGLNNETNVYLYLEINGSTVSSATIPQLNVDETYIIGFEWIPTRAGTYNITAHAPPVPGEDYLANNVATKWLSAYYTRSRLSHEWVGSGTPMGWHADDYSWQYTLPFDFPFYGIWYRTIYISSNGLITFAGPDSSLSNSIPGLASKLAIAPAWDDWVTDGSYDIYIWENATNIGIRWNVRHYGEGTIANFEAILRWDGVIQLNYEYSDGLVSATIGISNGAGNTLAEDLSILNFISTIVFTPFQLESPNILTITATAGGDTNPPPGTYSYAPNSTVQVFANPYPDYLFDHWELDGVNVGSANPCAVIMDQNHALNAVFLPRTPPIYIRADGSIDPPTAPITTTDNVTYTLTDSIANNGDYGIIVERGNVIIDGDGHTLQGSGHGYGFLVSVNNVTIRNTNIWSWSYGIHLSSSSNGTISGNNITYNDYGVWLWYGSNYNSIFGNSITANNYCGVTIEWSSYNSISRNTITANNYHGIKLDASSHNSIFGNSITANSYYGIRLDYSLFNSISGNTMANNYDAISMAVSSNNTISENSITANSYGGINLEYSSYNSIFRNNITDSSYGIWLYQSSNNGIYHNNFVGNVAQVYSENSINRWDDGYPSGGNYWSDHTGVDEKRGPNQDLIGNDGIIDTPCVIDANNQDHYPLKNPYGPPIITYSLTITATVGGTANPDPGTYMFTASSTFQVMAIQEADYLFDHWELDGVNVGSSNSYTVTMDKDHVLRAVFSLILHVDLNNDGTVNLLDLLLIAKAFGTFPGDPNYNPAADINRDGKINVLDLILVAIHIGEHWP